MDTIDISPVHRVAHVALACLRRAGENTAPVALRSGTSAEIVYAGPALPDAPPDDIADYETVRTQEPGWTGAHRLTIRAPLVVFDLAWNDGEPVRILTFCRGDWEAELLESTP